jgi:hypothetical protein
MNRHKTITNELLVPNVNNLWDWCLSRHYQLNDHHPEHFKDPAADMPLVARAELTCDLLACVWGPAAKQGRDFDVAKCRGVIENQNWRHWKSAITEGLEPANRDYGLPLFPRWQHFDPTEADELRSLYSSHSNGSITADETIERMLTLSSVRYYLEDLRNHQQSILDVWCVLKNRHCDSIFKSRDLECRIKRHDDDKWNYLMVLGYTLRWCFENGNELSTF